MIDLSRKHYSCRGMFSGRWARKQKTAIGRRWKEQWGHAHRAESSRLVSNGNVRIQVHKSKFTFYFTKNICCYWCPCVWITTQTKARLIQRIHFLFCRSPFFALRGVGRLVLPVYRVHWITSPLKINWYLLITYFLHTLSDYVSHVFIYETSPPAKTVPWLWEIVISVINWHYALMYTHFRFDMCICMLITEDTLELTH